MTVYGLTAVTLSPGLAPSGCAGRNCTSVAALGPLGPCGLSYGVALSSASNLPGEWSCTDYAGSAWFTVSAPSVELRLDSDPFAVCGAHTGCAHSFGESKAEYAAAAAVLFALGGSAAVGWLLIACCSAPGKASNDEKLDYSLPQ